MTDQLKVEKELLSPPGDDILETIEHIRMSQAELAYRLDKTPSKVHDLITGKEPITYNTAMQLEKVLGIDAQFWLNREMRYREKLARIEQEEKLAKHIEWLNQQPLKELKQFGFIKEAKKGPAMVSETLQFYGVVTPEKWREIYVNDYAAGDYRKSGAHEIALGSMAAWLRMGELEMRKIKLHLFNKELFKQKLEEIKDLVAKHPDDFAEELQQKCALAGVAIVYTPCLPKAPVSGVTRWIGGNPLIQLTDRHKTNDHFWFTFYHEAGHVLLHGKKEVFFEEFEGYKPDKQKEDEANEFASKWLLPQKALDELPLRISEEDLISIARKFNTHAGVVVGRLQHFGMAPYSFGNQLKLRIDLFKK